MSEWCFGRESGSGKETRIVLVTRVMKEAVDERMTKLMDEINFLANIPEKWRMHFPQVLYSGKQGNRVFYEMPNYPYPTLRKLIFMDALGKAEILKWLDRILAFYFEMANTQKKPMLTTYMKEIHTDRLLRRLDELKRKSPFFKSLIAKETLQVNNEYYDNIPVVYEKLVGNGVLCDCAPPFVSEWCHSDMHFSNIMLDLEHDNFILLDPRGYKQCDYYYDFGKLWHSVNGKYELIAERKFALDDNGFALEKNSVYALLEDLKHDLFQLLLKYSVEDAKATRMKTEFNEAVHFASLVPFLLEGDGVESRAKVAYFSAVVLLNNFYWKYGGMLA